MRGQAIHCLRQGMSIVADTWEKEGGGEKARLVAEEFELHSGRIGCLTRLAVMGGDFTGDIAGRDMFVEFVYGLREGEHGGPSVDIGSLVRR